MNVITEGIVMNTARGAVRGVAGRMFYVRFSRVSLCFTLNSESTFNEELPCK